MMIVLSITPAPVSNLPSYKIHRLIWCKAQCKVSLLPCRCSAVADWCSANSVKCSVKFPQPPRKALRVSRQSQRLRDGERLVRILLPSERACRSRDPKMADKSPAPGKKVQLQKVMSVRANLVPVRPPGESQKTLKKHAEKQMAEGEADERRRSALVQFMMRELARLGDTQQQAEEPPAEGPSEDDYFKPGYVVADRFKVVRKLHGGAFGQVYSARDETMNGGWVAVKIESLKCPTPLLSLETTVLRSLQDREHAPMYVAAGRIGDEFNYLAMQLLGPNLDSLRRRCPLVVQRFSISTAMRLATQCVVAIREMHKAGWVHRDIKASNFAIGGSKDTANVVYLLDFGLCREHIVNGKVRPERRTAGFRGTVRYAPIATHVMKDLGRKDDLWSMFYTIGEWLNGGLPWSNEADAEIVYQMKRTTPFEKLSPRLPELMMIIGGHLQGLKYADEPDYALIEITLQRVCQTKSVRQSDPFDWDNEFELLKKE